jgi:hypothetical protein
MAYSKGKEKEGKLENKGKTTHIHKKIPIQSLMIQKN